MGTRYYNLKNILEKNAVYSMIIGERSNGKSYAALYYALENFIFKQSQTAIIRRWKEDITGRRAAQVFENLNANNCVIDLCRKYKKIKDNGEPLYTGITYFAGKWFCCSYDDDGKPVYNRETDCIAYAFALSDMEHDKSLSYPHIKTIIFDEFITKNVYLQDEFILFMNTVSTIVRRRTDVKIFMLGNTVNKYCPYFDEMGLKHISKMEQGSIDLYNYGDSKLSVAVEYCASIKNKKSENNFYFAFNNPKLHMITNGAWELAIYPHCPQKYKPKNVLFHYFIEFQEELFQCEIVMVDNNNMFTFIHRKTTPLQNDSKDLIYSLEFTAKMNYNRNILKPINKIQKKILWFFKLDKVFYQDNSVGDSIANYLKICRGM